MTNLFKNIRARLTKIKLRNFPVALKLSLSFSFIIIFMVILSFIDFSYYKEDKSQTTLSVVNQMNLQAITETDTYLQDITNLTKVPLYYDSIGVIKNLELSNSNSEVFFSMQKDLNYLIESIFSLKKDIHSVFIFNLNGDNEFKIKNASLYRKFNPSSQSWFKQSIINFGKPVVIPTFTLENVTENNKPPKVFSVARGLVRYESARVVGVILINGKIDVLSNIINKLLIYPGQRILMINNEGYVIYDTRETNIGKMLPEDEQAVLLSSNFASKEDKVNGVKSIITKENSEFSGWQLVNIIPTSSLNKSINQMKNRSYMLTIFFVLISGLYVIVISRQIVNPIKRLATVMRIVETGDFDVKVEVQSRDEIGKLSKTFNIMTTKIKDLINEVYVDKINKKELELQMLQNQINPHFIYNTLESIHMMAEINKDKETSRMAVTLGNILRYGLSNKQKKVTIKDEIKNLEAYVMLMQTRYENIESFIIEVDEELYSCQSIKLIFQPIVENAIYHGLDSLEAGGKIKLTGYKDNTDIVFEISDNGAGMAEEQTHLLNGYVNDLNDSFSSIGLKNVNMRIKLHYGAAYGIHIISQKDSGTTVKVRLPYKPS